MSATTLEAEVVETTRNTTSTTKSIFRNILANIKKAAIKVANAVKNVARKVTGTIKNVVGTVTAPARTVLSNMMERLRKIEIEARRDNGPAWKKGVAFMMRSLRVARSWGLLGAIVGAAYGAAYGVIFLLAGSSLSAVALFFVQYVAIVALMSAIIGIVFEAMFGLFDAVLYA